MISQPVLTEGLPRARPLVSTSVFLTWQRIKNEWTQPGTVKSRVQGEQGQGHLTVCAGLSSFLLYRRLS